jgi:hypothetical protein
MKTRLIFPILAILLVLMACSIQVNTTDPPPPSATATETSTQPSPPAPSVPPASDLTLDSLRNAIYDISAFTGTPRAVTLVNGSYTSGSDPASVDYLSVFMGNTVASGDLNYDGANDAAVILGITTGGTGVFTYIAAVLNIASTPVHAASIFIDDRPIINSLSITAGEILSDIIIHGVDDPGCCASFQTQQGFRLYGGELVLTRRVIWSAGNQRAIDINIPFDLDSVDYPLIVSGSVTIGPFENTLAYAIYTSENTLVTQSSVMTDSPNPGDPGSFTLPVDLSMAGVYGLVRIEFSELSMMDGSLMTLDSVLVNVH